MTRRFTLEIECENEAFACSELDAQCEVARILDYAASRVEKEGDQGSGLLYDTNGNRVGSYAFHGWKRSEFIGGLLP